MTDINGYSIDWKYLEYLVKIQNDEGLHAATELRNRHVNFKNEIQKVKIAPQTFSNSVAGA